MFPEDWRSEWALAAVLIAIVIGVTWHYVDKNHDDTKAREACVAAGGNYATDKHDHLTCTLPPRR